MTAGCALFADREHTPVGVRSYCRRLRAVARTGPAGLAVPVVPAVVLVFDWAAVRAGLPGHQVLGPLILLIAAGAAAVGLRAAALWRLGATWTSLWRGGAEAARADPYGTALLAFAVVAAAVVCWTFPVVIPLALGQLVLAAVAVDARVTGAATQA
ncbi:hypothetical protein [Actinomadura sp. HBU206391]|uniref:hypothetical protein n=1 Tax=Actinomadura sp. HBU206391 TaxID=2731692 RepID=UPI00164EEC0B|nr:hypothetical protein [Actinomadura sp. HBU206391]MBC6460925.1 hypothetical protein [Actinomadura sp. HBU206391]